MGESGRLAGGLIVAFMAVCFLIPVYLFFFSSSPLDAEENVEESRNVSVDEKDEQSDEQSVPTEEVQEESDNGIKEEISSGNNWRCACEGGFLPPGMLQSLGGAEAVMRMSAGQCYHKQM